MQNLNAKMIAKDDKYAGTRRIPDGEYSKTNSKRKNQRVGSES